MESINTPNLDSRYYLFIGDILFHNVYTVLMLF